MCYLVESDLARVKVLARRVSSRPMDTHFWKKHKENSANLLYVLEKHAFWTASFQRLTKSLEGGMECKTCSMGKGG